MTEVRLHPAICGLMPHAPIVVPDVAPRDAAACRDTTEACEEFARRVVAAGPDRLFLVSPHAPRAERAFGLWSGTRLRGDLGTFGLPAAAVDLPNDLALVDALAGCAGEHGVETWPIPPLELDHGSVVPLWFLYDAGWRGPTCIASLAWRSTMDEHRRLGAALAAAVATCGGRAALVASGDLSHRTTQNAPAGYDPRGVVFDHELEALIRDGRLDRIPGIDPALRAAAAEDAADSATIVASAIGFGAHGHEVLSYEHPFGVGYLVGVFHDGVPSGDRPSRGREEE